MLCRVFHTLSTFSTSFLRILHFFLFPRCLDYTDRALRIIYSPVQKNCIRETSLDLCLIVINKSHYCRFFFLTSICILFISIIAFSAMWYQSSSNYSALVNVLFSEIVDYKSGSQILCQSIHLGKYV